MVSNLPDEKKLPLSKIVYLRGFQTTPVPPAAEMQQDAASFTSATVKKEPEWQTKEISTFHEYKLIRRRQVSHLEDIGHLKTPLQELKTWLEEKEKDLIKEKKEISEEKGLIIQQNKILEDMQIKISHLEEQLKHTELIGLPQGKKVENCPCSFTPKIQKSTGRYLRKIRLYFGIFLWLLDRFLLNTGRLCIALALFSKHVPDPTWLDWILKGIFHQYNRSYLWPH